MVFKCKMCGGDLEIKDKSFVGTCQYCGSTMTLPRLDDDKRLNLYNRANHFRRSGEFDKASAIYEQILNEDTLDSEAYWSLVLCEYGIEYVEDPKNHKRIPTCNRTQYTSVFANENYKQAIANADSSAREIFESEAKAIDDIQKCILTISSREKPFDVFICYKESDDKGMRTPDSVLAQEMYYQLTQEGFKVFFSRITLEDKLGTAYEPYIFAALNSSQVMVIIGTKQEYFNAVWVKNEWSRYLALIKNGAKKTLIPAYKDMDPYDLPEELSHLQAQDMAKLGFMQDLIRGIKKITNTDNPAVTVSNKAETQTAVNVAPLLERAFLCLEAGDFKKADDLIEMVLNTEPQNAAAYMGKLMVNLGVKQMDDLTGIADPLTNYATFNNAVRFADAEQKTRYLGINQKILDRKEAEKFEIYQKAVESFNIGDYTQAEQIFTNLKDYKDCHEYIAEKIPSAKYGLAITLFESGDYVQAEQVFRNLGNYNDCLEYVTSRIPEAKYALAQTLVRNGEYDKARQLFFELGDYKDSKKQLKKKHGGFAQAVYKGIILTFALWGFLSFIGVNGLNIYQKIFVSLNSGNLMKSFFDIIIILLPALLCLPVAILASILIDKNFLLNSKKTKSKRQKLAALWAALYSIGYLYFGFHSPYSHSGSIVLLGLFVIPLVVFLLLLLWYSVVLAIAVVIQKRLPQLLETKNATLAKGFNKYKKPIINASIALLTVVALSTMVIKVFNESTYLHLAQPASSLSYGRPSFTEVHASSSLKTKNAVYTPSNAVDGNVTSAWVEGVKGNGTGEWIEVKTNKKQNLTGFNITAGNIKTESLYYANSRPKKLTILFDDGSQQVIVLKDLYNTTQRISFSNKKSSKSVKFILSSVYAGKAHTDTYISEISFF